MKKLFFVFGLVLALLFAPVVFGLQLIQNAPDLEFSFEVMNGDRPEIIIFDYAGSLQDSAVVLIKTRLFKNQSYIMKRFGSLEEIPETINQTLEAGNREGVGKVIL